MKKSILTLALAALTLLGPVADSMATVTAVYFTQKNGGAVSVPGFLQDMADSGNQGGASIVDTRANFLTAVGMAGLATGTESFEGDAYSPGVNGFPPFVPNDLPDVLNPLVAPLDFGAAGTGTLTAVGNVLDVADYVPLPADPQWRFPYDDGAAHAGETRYIGSVPEGDPKTMIVLDQAANAFGFFASDVGDKDALMSVELFYSGGGSTLLDLADYGYLANEGNSTSIYFGVITDMAFDKVEISYQGAVVGSDRYGLDVLSIGVAVANSVPETGHTLLLGSSMLGFLAVGSVAARRRRKNAA